MFDFIEKLLKVRTAWIITSLLIVYFIFMFVLPFVNNNCGNFDLGCSWDSLIKVLYDWQTFNASVLTFIASILVIFSTTISERRKNTKKRAAQHAFLPHALTEVLTYIENIMGVFESIQNDGKNRKLPEIPVNALNRIEKFIEVSEPEDELIVKHLVIVTNTIQVYNSRLNTLISDKSIGNKKEQAFENIKLCVLFERLVSGMYDFARSEKESYKVTSLDKKKLSSGKFPCYLTEQEMNNISSQEITLNLFCTGKSSSNTA